VGELAAGVAHEANNPVNFAVNSFKTLLARVDDVRTLVVALADVVPGDPTTLNERLRHLQNLKEKLGFADLVSDLEELVAIATEGLERTHRLVGDLQDFARPGSHVREPVDVRKALAATIRLMRTATRDAGALVESEFDPELPLVQGCASTLNQTFLNLLKNATEALEGRGGTIRVAATHDRNESKNRDDVVITISDDGPGIAPQIRERLFEPFFTTKQTGRGSGLGLSVCRRILDEVGGTIDLRSHDGDESAGATFEIRLPVLTNRTEKTETALEEPISEQAV
jgi:signal transduction histidine kinase